MTTKKFALEENFVSGTIDAVRNSLYTYKGTVGRSLSVADVSKIARIEPITIVSNDLVSTKELYNILHGVLNIYAGYYIQAISILATQLEDIRILKILDRTNPDRDLKTMLTAGYVSAASTESRNLETLSLAKSKYKLNFLSNSKVSQEGRILPDENENVQTLGTSISKIETFEKLGPAIGKVIELKFKVRPENSKDTNEVSIPVAVKLDTMILDADIVNNILTLNKDEITFSSRLSDVLSGRISFIKDFLLASDLIKNQKKILYKNNSEAYAAILKRVNNSRIYSGLSGNVSVAGVSSIYVLSEKSEAMLAKKLGGRLSSPKIRSMIFENTMAMVIVVIDREWERVSIYVRDMDGFSQNSFDAFKTQSDKGSSQILDMFKSFTMGNAPSF